MLIRYSTYTFGHHMTYVKFTRETYRMYVYISTILSINNAHIFFYVL